LILSQEDLNKIGCNLSDDYSKNVIITRTLNKSGSYRIDFKYEKMDNGYLYISQTLIHNITYFHTVINSQLNVIIENIIYKLHGLTLIEIPTTQRFGKDSKVYVLLNTKHGPVGNIIRIRYKKIIFSAAIVGIYFNQEDSYKALIEELDKRIKDE
jgi:hypothetical protein